MALSLQPARLLTAPKVADAVSQDPKSSVKVELDSTKGVGYDSLVSVIDPRVINQPGSLKRTYSLVFLVNQVAISNRLSRGLHTHKNSH